MPFFGSRGARGSYLWTAHSKIKMRHYRLTESRVARVIRHPARVEEGILKGAVAAMQPAGGKHYSEIWALYVIVRKRENAKSESRNPKHIKVITAWRYPGKAPERDPVPAEVLREIKKIL